MSTDKLDRWTTLIATRLWNMGEDATWFEETCNVTSDRSSLFTPLYEAKMLNIFDHRWAGYKGENATELTFDEKLLLDCEPRSRYSVPTIEVENRLNGLGWSQRWLLAWRNITSGSNERTLICSLLPRVAVGHTAALILPMGDVLFTCGLFANLNALIVDYVARVKISGSHLTLGLLEQLPILPPSAYSTAALAFIVSRVLELTYTSYSLAPFARDLGHAGPPFAWNEARRATLRAELDAWYARAYGLTRDELRYVLNPADTHGPTYPSETFRVLREKEVARYGEYRTRRLVLDAWDHLDDSSR